MSRRFITATAERLAELRSRPLDDQRWLICFLDGFDFAGHTMIGALGVIADGTKVPLGVGECSTENASVVRHLIAGLRDRRINTYGHGMPLTRLLRNPLEAGGFVEIP